jgi:hypothetical protein
VRLGELRCPAAGRCRVTVPKRVGVRIGGRTYRVAVLAPKTIAAGKRAQVRVHLTKAPAARLKGRTAKVVVPVRVTTNGTTTSQRLWVTARR